MTHKPFVPAFNSQPLVIAFQVSYSSPSFIRISKIVKSFCSCNWIAAFSSGESPHINRLVLVQIFFFSIASLLNTCECLARYQANSSVGSVQSASHLTLIFESKRFPQVQPSLDCKHCLFHFVKNPESTCWPFLLTVRDGAFTINAVRNLADKLELLYLT